MSRCQSAELEDSTPLKTCQLQHRTALLGMLSGNSGLWDCNDWQCRERWSTILLQAGEWLMLIAGGLAGSLILMF